MFHRAPYKSRFMSVMLALALAGCRAITPETPTPTASPDAPPIAQSAETPTTAPPTPTAPPATASPTPSFITPHPILGDVRVRRAIAHCTDRADLIRSVYPWLEDPTLLDMDSFIPPEHWAYPQDQATLVRYPFDPEKGRALLEEAGWGLATGATYRTNMAGEELALTLTTTQAEFRKTWTAAFEEQMKACGLRIVRRHTPAEWFFGDATGLARRDFELAAFAWVSEADPGGRNLYACDQIPAPENGWRGQNYAGWCNPAADQAIRTATGSLDPQTRRQAYHIVQAEFTRDLPSLPLFRRVGEILASHPALQGAALDVSQELYTWNAAQWVIPGKETLVIGEKSDPASLLPLEPAFITQVLRALIAGLDYTSLNYGYQPVTLKRLPTLDSGAATNNIVEVKEGEHIVDAEGNAVALTPGVRLRDAAGNEVDFKGGAVQMKQLVVRYEFVDGLTWSDGVAVSKADYELAYHYLCDPATLATLKSWSANLPAVCDKAARVEFVGDAAYVVTWKPGYQDPRYFLPPIDRQPAHQVLSDGRRLAEVPASQWGNYAEVSQRPLGVGPYVLKEWTYGQRMVFTANPFYFQGPPATPNLIVRFIMMPEAAVGALIAGELDLLSPSAVLPEQAEKLLAAQAAGQVRVSFFPGRLWEHLTFALFVK